MRVQRGGEDTGRKVMIHGRERWTSVLALKFAAQIEKYAGVKGSFMLWNKNKKYDKKNKDPNYLTQNMMKTSKFHCGLHKWAKYNNGMPLFHIDVHGKKDAKKHVTLDLGTMPMNVKYPDQYLWNSLTTQLAAEFRKVFKGMKINGMPANIDDDPRLHGFWGTNV